MIKIAISAAAFDAAAGRAVRKEQTASGKHFI
jgi:hypothetical protein